MASSVREISFAVDNARGDAVDCDVRFVEGEEDKPVVIFCHGFKGVSREIIGSDTVLFT